MLIAWFFGPFADLNWFWTPLARISYLIVFVMRMWKVEREVQKFMYEIISAHVFWGFIHTKKRHIWLFEAYFPLGDFFRATPKRKQESGNVIG